MKERKKKNVKQLKGGLIFSVEAYASGPVISSLVSRPSAHPHTRYTETLGLLSRARKRRLRLATPYSVLAEGQP